MDIEHFIEEAKKLGFTWYDKGSDIHYFLIDGIGISYFRGLYQPLGCALCKYWTDDILLERIRQKVLLDGGAEIAYDYLELLSSLERERNVNSDSNSK